MKDKWEYVDKFQIAGRTWQYGWGDTGKTKGKANEGICDYENRRVIINRQHKCHLADVVSHELLHAYFPHWKEEFVDGIGESIGTAIKHLKYSISPGPKLIAGRRGGRSSLA